LDRVQQEGVSLNKVADVNFGKQLRDRKKFLKDVILVPVSGKIPDKYNPCYTGEDITRYHVTWSRLACFDVEEARCGGCWDSAKQNATDKLLTRQIGLYPEFGLDLRGYQCLNTIFMVNVREEACDVRWLLGVLNSSLMRAYWTNRFYDQRRTFPKIKGTYLEELPIKLPKSKAEKTTSKQIAKLVGEILLAQNRIHNIPLLLSKRIAHAAERAICSTAHYLQTGFAPAMKSEILIDDVQRAGFVHAIDITSEGEELTLTATVADNTTDEPRALPVLRLVFHDTALRWFIYACWKRFLSEHSRQKRWTKGKKPEPVYPLLVNTLEPLVYFQPSAGDNLRVIHETMDAVAEEAGSSDLAAVETEISKLDAEIDERVYELYGLTQEERALIERRAK